MKLTQKLGLAYYRTNLKLLALVSPQKAAKKALKLFSTPFVKSSSKPAPIFDEGELLTFTLGGILITGNRWNHRAKKKVLIVHGLNPDPGTSISILRNWSVTILKYWHLTLLPTEDQEERE